MSLNGQTVSLTWERELGNIIVGGVVVVGDGPELVYSNQIIADIDGDEIKLELWAGHIVAEPFVGMAFRDSTHMLPDLGGITILSNSFGDDYPHTVLGADLIGINLAGVVIESLYASVTFRLEFTPWDMTLSSQQIRENVTGAIIGDLTVADINDADTHTFAVDDARFEVVGGQLKLVDGVALDFEGDASITVTVTATDSFGLAYQEAFTVYVDDINDAPSGANMVVIMKEDTTHRFMAAEFGFSDTDGDALAAVIIDTLPGSGSLRLNGVAVTAGQTIAAEDLADLSWRPAKNAFGAALASFNFRVVDDGGTVNDGVDTDTTVRTLTIDVTDVMDRINGGRGDNLVRGTSGNDRLRALEGDDVLRGFGGNDNLRSIGGNDRFWGGTGADTFVYSTGSGRDRIMDFENGIDRIDVRKWAVMDDFAELKSHAKNKGGDLWITHGKDALVIEDFTRRQFDASDVLI